MNLLIDSSVWIAALGRQPVPAFAKHLDQVRREHRILTTGAVRQEVMLGSESWQQFLEYQLLFEEIPEVETHAETWTGSARIFMRMKEKGFNLSAGDLLIAAVALENNLTLLHADQDFEYLAEHEGLKTESLLHLIPAG